MDKYDTFILTRAALDSPTTSSSQYNQTVNITLEDDVDTYYIQNDETSVDGSETKYNYSTSIKTMFARTDNDTWSSANAVTWIYLFNSTTNAGRKMMTYKSDTSYTWYWYYVDMTVWTKCIIVRCDPSGTTWSWDYKWGQSCDITLSESTNCIQITGWGNSYSTYTYTTITPE